MATPTGQTWPLHGVPLSPLYPYIEAEARYACRHEYAQTAVDFVARRTRISFLNVQATLETLPRVIEIMGEELGWDKGRREWEFDNAQEFLKSMGLPEQPKLKLSDVAKKPTEIGHISMAQRKDKELFDRAQFTPDEVAHLRSQFEQLDFDHDQRITRADLLNAMKKMGYASSNETADSILREVDFGRKGAIEFQEYLDIAAGLKELHIESAFTHLAQLDTSRNLAEGDAIGKHANDSSEQRSDRRKIPVERSGGGT